MALCEKGPRVPAPATPAEPSRLGVVTGTLLSRARAHGGRRQLFRPEVPGRKRKADSGRLGSHRWGSSRPECNLVTRDAAAHSAKLHRLPCHVSRAHSTHRWWRQRSEAVTCSCSDSASPSALHHHRTKESRPIIPTCFRSVSSKPESWVPDRAAETTAAALSSRALEGLLPCLSLPL